MTTLSVVLGDGTPDSGAGQAALIAPLLNALQPGDEVICPLAPPAAPSQHALRHAAAGRKGTLLAFDDDGLAASDHVTLRLLPLAANPPAGGIVGCALGRARGAAVLWLPGASHHASPAAGPASMASVDFAALPGLRAAIAGGSDLALAAGGLMLLHRDLLRRAVLPLPETPLGLEQAAFFWRATLGARRPHEPPALTGCGALPGTPPPLDRAEAIFSLFAPLDRLIAGAGGDAAAREAARDWLLRGVGTHLAGLPLWQLWDYAAAAQPLAAASWLRDRAGAGDDPQVETARRALRALADRPLWHCVLDWRAMRLAGRQPGSGQSEEVAHARALWQAMRRTGSG